MDKGKTFLYEGARAIAYFEGKICWYRPGLTTIELSRVNLEAQRRDCTVIHKCSDAIDFENVEDGTKKIIEDFKSKTTIETVAKEVEATAFHYVKELVPLLESTVLYLHYAHPSDFKSCANITCSSYRKLMSAIDKNLFHGTLEDLTGVKP